MIDFSSIEKLEGLRLEGYVSDPGHCSSGVTIVSGVEFWQQNKVEIISGFPFLMASKLIPYVAIKRDKAINCFQQ